MKFGKFIQNHSIPEWSAQYVNYKALKKIIAMAEQTSGSGACSNADLRASGDGERLFVTVQASPPPELVRDGAVPASRHVATPDTSLNFDDDTRKSARALGESSDAGHENAFSGKHKEIDCGVQAVVADSSPPIDAGSPSASPTPVGWSSAKTLFFFRIERELEKVNSFYLHKETEFKNRLRSLLDKKKLILGRDGRRYGNVTLSSLKEAFVEYHDGLTKLQKFVEMNATGFRKILKKWDKRSKSHTKEIYLSHQVDIQPCFNKEVLTELADTAAFNLAELERFNPDKSDYSSNVHVTDTVAPTRHQVLQPSNVDSSNSAVPPHTGYATELEEDMVVKMLLTAPTTTVFDEIENYSAMDYDVCKRVFWRLCSHPTVGEDLLQLVVKHFPNLDFNYTDDVSDRSCLHEACAAGNVAMVRICVENGASRASKDIYGRKPIHYAAMNGHKDCLAVLLAAGTENVDSIDHDGYPPLLYAVIRGRTGCVRLLLDHHAVVDGCAIPELSPLSLACQSGHLEVATLLLERGARSIPNADGLLPLHIACREGHGLLAKLLIANGAQVNGVDRYNNWQPIFYAASEGHVDCVRVLLETGCQAATVDESKWTPYAYALWNGHVDVADLLDTVSSFARTGSEPKIEEMPPLSLDDNVAGDAELLPSLELPPPFIYGHHYLDNKTEVRVVLGHKSCSSKLPIKLFGTRQLSSLKLVISQRPVYADTIVHNIPYTVILPSMDDDTESFAFVCDALDMFSLQFDIYPTFGSSVVGRAVVLPQEMLITTACVRASSGFLERGSGGYYAHYPVSAPLFDHRLRVVGELNFEFVVVLPFSHPKMDLGHAGVYWKATTVISNSTKMGVLSASMNIRSDECSPTIPGSPMLGHQSSLVTATSLASEYARFVVQLTKDLVPVVYDGWTVSVAGIEVPLSHMTAEQFHALAVRSPEPEYSRSSIETITAYQRSSHLSLADVMKTLPAHLGIMVDIKYPFFLRSNAPAPHVDINGYIDAVLQVVYDHINITMSARTSRRNVIFASFNPDVCHALNLKQPNFAVFYECHCGYDVAGDVDRPAVGSGQQRYAESIKEAVRFAKNCNLLGIICAALPLVRVPFLIKAIKESGLLVATFGKENGQAANVELQSRNGVDGIVMDGVYRVLNSASI